MNIDDDLEKLLRNLPFFIYQHLYNYPNKDKLIEIVPKIARPTRHVNPLIKN